MTRSAFAMPELGLINKGLRIWVWTFCPMDLAHGTFCSSGGSSVIIVVRYSGFHGNFVGPGFAIACHEAMLLLCWRGPKSDDLCAESYFIFSKWQFIKRATVAIESGAQSAQMFGMPRTWKANEIAQGSFGSRHSAFFRCKKMLDLPCAQSCGSAANANW